jgi:hypothetical protein
MALFSIFDSFRSKPDPKKVSIYLPGGGTTAIWQVGFLAEMEEQGYIFNNFVCSSAGSFAALIAVAARIKKIPMKSLAAELVNKVHNDKLIDWTGMAIDVIASLLKLDVKEFTLWSRENYSKAFAEAFDYVDPQTGKQRLLNLGDIQDSGINLAIQFTVDQPDESIRYPLLLTVGPYQEYTKGKRVNEHQIREMDFGTVAAIAMCFPGLLPPANDFVRTFGVPIPPGAKVIDGDLVGDPDRIERTTTYVYNSPTLLALKWFKRHARKGEKLIALTTSSHDNQPKGPVYTYMAGIDEAERKFNNNDDDGFKFIVDKFDPGENIPILFNHITQFYDEGIQEAKRFLATLA